MIQAIRDRMEGDEDGFTLIELLVVVIIIGILAAIAIPTFLDQRTGARESAVDASLRSGGTYMETYYTANNAYPTTLADLQAEGFRPGSVTVTFGTVTSGFCLQGVHTDDTSVSRHLNASDGASGVPEAGACPTP